MSHVERRNHNLVRDKSLYYVAKKENIMKKCRLYQSLIKEKDDEIRRVIRGRALEKLPFMDQMKLADMNLSLDILHYKLSYCTKHLELIYKYVKIMPFYCFHIYIYKLMHAYYLILYVLINRLKRFNPNKPPPSHRISDEFSEVTSLVRQCRSRDINYDEKIIKIEGDFSDVPDTILNIDEDSSDDSGTDDEHIPDKVGDTIKKTSIQKRKKKRNTDEYLPLPVKSADCYVASDEEDDGDEIIETGKTKFIFEKYQWINELHEMDEPGFYGK